VIFAGLSASKRLEMVCSSRIELAWRRMIEPGG